MAFKLTREELDRKNELLHKLHAERTTIDEAVEAFNEALTVARDKLNASIDTYNEAREEVRGFVEDIARQAEEDYGDKSERWQEGERGEQVQEWINELQSFTAFDDIERYEEETYDPLCREDLATDFDNLPNEPEE